MGKDHKLTFICKRVLGCPDGAVTGIRFSIFDEAETAEMKNWLLAANNPYDDRSLIGCEIKEPDNDRD